MELTRRTPEELTTLARGIITNRIYAAWDTEAIEHSFGMFLALAASSAETQGESTDWMNDIGVVYEDMDKVMPRSVNGYPAFMSAQFVHRDDRIPLHRECIRMSVALGEIPEEKLTEFDEALAKYLEENPE